jgi:hypothetical protein
MAPLPLTIKYKLISQPKTGRPGRPILYSACIIHDEKIIIIMKFCLEKIAKNRYYGLVILTAKHGLNL